MLSAWAAQPAHLAGGHLGHELLELRRGTALAAVLGVERDEVEVVLDLARG